MPPALVTRPSAESPDAPNDLRLAQDGDTEAFARIYRLHVGRINALALRLTGDRSRAEALVQDAFVRAWQKLRSFRGASALATWLHRLTVNVFLLDERGLRRRALRELPEAYRETMIMRLVEGMTGPEIAERTGLTPDNKIIGHFTATGVRSHFSERFRLWGYDLPAAIFEPS